MAATRFVVGIVVRMTCWCWGSALRLQCMDFVQCACDSRLRLSIRTGRWIRRSRCSLLLAMIFRQRHPLGCGGRGVRCSWYVIVTDRDVFRHRISLSFGYRCSRCIRGGGLGHLVRARRNCDGRRCRARSIISEDVRDILLVTVRSGLNTS